MEGIWLASYVALWAFVLLQAIVLFVVLRELGIRVLNTAAAASRDGLSIGLRVPEIDAIAARSDRPQDRWSLLVFGSHRCGPCQALAPELNVFARTNADKLDAFFVTEDNPEGARRTAAELNLDVPVIGQRGAADRFKVRRTPFAYVVDGAGVIRAKGVVNNRSGLEAIFRAARPDRRTTAERTTEERTTEERRTRVHSTPGSSSKEVG